MGPLFIVCAQYAQFRSGLEFIFWAGWAALSVCCLIKNTIHFNLPLLPIVKVLLRLVNFIHWTMVQKLQRSASAVQRLRVLSCTKLNGIFSFS